MLAILTAFVLLCLSTAFAFQGGKLREMRTNADRDMDGKVGLTLSLLVSALALACARYL